ncbi:hypothetical protein [Methylobacterium platani]|uniref:3',5'-cyclic-nucleotide phosphodiesterase n=2 Tax=Methylobacterium platani TaxID=427683 RepID=A0A179S775_9HYPH|nr:hypothetical protein [Methylobacterium platani]KMO20960.1 hypothetical protein SQ03_04635 [Methylobacterium platani JCM 14648]OAS23323.1 hypothetical protein A5481_16775 [Methylobacterium platani]
MLLRSTLILALTAGAALAEPAAIDRTVLKQYCTGDYLTYCGNLSPDGPEVQACFRQNKAKLSPNCQAAIASYVKAQRRS